MGYFSDQEMNRRLANLRHAMDNQSVEAVPYHISPQHLVLQ